MSAFKKYRRTNIAELRPVTEEEAKLGRVSCPNVSISVPDLQNGSPKVGDMIARNPKDHTDKWLVAEKYFHDNFEEITLENANVPRGDVTAFAATGIRAVSYAANHIAQAIARGPRQLWNPFIQGLTGEFNATLHELDLPSPDEAVLGERILSWVNKLTDMADKLEALPGGVDPDVPWALRDAAVVFTTVGNTLLGDEPPKE